jgi:hypothetical protein
MVPNSGAVEAGRVDTAAAVTPQIQGKVIEATIVAQITMLGTLQTILGKGKKILKNKKEIELPHFF